MYEVGVRPSISDLRANSNHIKVQSGFVVLWGSAINGTSRDNTSCGLRQVPPTHFSEYQLYGAGCRIVFPQRPGFILGPKKELNAVMYNFYNFSILVI